MALAGGVVPRPHPQAPTTVVQGLCLVVGWGWVQREVGAVSFWKPGCSQGSRGEPAGPRPRALPLQRAQGGCLLGLVMGEKV